MIENIFDIDDQLYKRRVTIHSATDEILRTEEKNQRNSLVDKKLEKHMKKKVSL